MKNKNKILIVDDSELNRSLLADILSEDYDLLEVDNGSKAVTLLNQSYSEISLVLLDIVMPEMDGFDVLAAMNKNGWIDSVPVITISAENSSAYIDHAYDLGAVDYINRPFDVKTVRHRVKNTIVLYAKQKYLENLVTEQILEKEKTNLIMVDVLGHIVEFRNGESGLHVLNIRILTELLLKYLGKITDQYDLSPVQIALITNASALHDIGKISIPEHILNKPGKLTSEEYETMKSHSEIGAQILENTPYYQSEELLKTAAVICRSHHERYDGRGYPNGLKGEAIPIGAQVVSLADVYDALTNTRVYKPAYSHETAMEMILNGECGIFNPLLLKCLQAAGPHIKNELKHRSAGDVSRVEVQTLSHSLIHKGAVSNRTLALLEQERTKYQFFASMSNEIQFEYAYHSDLLTISEWGAERLGLNEIISHPRENEALCRVFAEEDYLDLQKCLRAATPEDPIVSKIYRVNVSGENRWYKAVVRPLWVVGERDEFTGVIGKFVDVHEEQLELERLKRMAKCDALTGISNRVHACEAIKNALAEGRKEDRKFALLLFDLDYFKEANDQYGHIFGDRVLQTVAQKVRSSVRESDIVARIVGDEFLIFMEYKEGIQSLVKRVYQAIGGEYRNFDITISMGVALSPEHGTEYNELFHHADQALYAAKKDGRKHYCFFDNSMYGLLSVLSPVDRDM